MSNPTKTNPRLIAIMKKLGGHEFTENDWAGFAGCEAKDPWMAEVGDDLIIADGNSMVLINAETPDESLTLQGPPESKVSIDSLDLKGIIAALLNEGYTDTEILGTTFTKMLPNGKAMYAISFCDEEGTGDGFVYVEQRDGKFYADY